MHEKINKKTDVFLQKCLATDHLFAFSKEHEFDFNVYYGFCLESQVSNKIKL